MRLLFSGFVSCVPDHGYNVTGIVTDFFKNCMFFGEIFFDKDFKLYISMNLKIKTCYVWCL